MFTDLGFTGLRWFKVLRVLGLRVYGGTEASANP